MIEIHKHNNLLNKINANITLFVSLYIKICFRNFFIHHRIDKKIILFRYILIEVLIFKLLNNIYERIFFFHKK